MRILLKEQPNRRKNCRDGEWGAIGKCTVRVLVDVKNGWRRCKNVIHKCRTPKCGSIFERNTKQNAMCCVCVCVWNWVWAEWKKIYRYIDDIHIIIHIYSANNKSSRRQRGKNALSFENRDFFAEWLFVGGQHAKCESCHSVAACFICPRVRTRQRVRAMEVNVNVGVRRERYRERETKKKRDAEWESDSATAIDCEL